MEVEFFDQSFDVSHDPGRQPFRVGRRSTEASATSDALVLGTLCEDGLYGRAVQFPPQPLPLDRQQLPHQTAVGLEELPTGPDAMSRQLGTTAFADPRNLLHGLRGQKPQNLRFLKQHPATERLGRVRDEFGKGLRPRDPHAHGDADLVQNPTLKCDCRLVQRTGEDARKLTGVEEHLVNRVILDCRADGVQQVEQLPRKDFVPAEVPFQEHALGATDSRFPNGHPGLHADRLGLVALGDDARPLVSQDASRDVPHGVITHSLARNVKAVRVEVCDHEVHGRRCTCTWVHCQAAFRELHLRPELPSRLPCASSEPGKAALMLTQVTGLLGIVGADATHGDSACALPRVTDGAMSGSQIVRRATSRLRRTALGQPFGSASPLLIAVHGRDTFAPTWSAGLS